MLETGLPCSTSGLPLASLTVVNGANHVGDELLMVPFSEPETGPSEGSSKRHKRQVKVSAIGVWHRGTKEMEPGLTSKYTQGPSSTLPGFGFPFLPDPDPIYPFPS